GFRYPDIDSAVMKDAFSLYNINMYHNLSWREKIGSGLKMISGFSYSTNKDDIGSEFQNENNQKQILNTWPFSYKNFGVVTHGKYANAKVVIEKRLKGLNAIRFGSEYNHSNETSDFTSDNGTKGREYIKENLLSAF